MSSKGKKQAPALRVDPRDLVEASVSQELLEKAARELPREKVLTPFRVSQKLGVKVSTAKRVLRRLVELGLLKLAGGTRRSRIYTPASEGKA